MTPNWGFGLCSLGLASSLAVGGAIATSGNCVLAQITPDGTQGAESSVVTPNVDINGVPSDQIDGGAIRGTNLFHSFQEFNIGEGRGAYFTNPAAITNILGRVTGNDPSDIFGKLGVLGNANLFLINPNGIIFGQNASLDLGGSFVGTTANAIGFGNQGFFSASAPDVPPLLTVNPNAFLFNQVGAGEIAINSRRERIDIGFDTDYRLYGQKLAQVEGLKVSDGQSLLLLGGDIFLDGGTLQAPGGRVELGAVSGRGTVGLNGDGSMSFPDSLARADIFFTNGAEVNVLAGGGGSIGINAQNLNLAGTEKSSLQAGIYTGSGSIGSFAGNIEINATGTISLFDGSFIANTVLPKAVGNSGNININTGSLFLTDGTNLTTSTLGQGNAGNVNINARDTVSLDSSVAFSSVENIIVGNNYSFNGVAVGNAGDINITTGSLFVTNAAKLQAYTLGQGNAGNVNINARDTVSLNGVDSDEPSAVYSSVEEGSVGNGGDINITTGSLSVTNGAYLSANTSAQGNAGSVNINARDTVSFDGMSRNGFNSAAFSAVEDAAVGNGGTINITTESLSLTDGANVSASSDGSGAAGNIKVSASSIRLDNQAFITVNPVDASGLIAHACQAGGGQASEFIVTGRGGLPENPNETLSSDAVQVDLVTLNPKIENRSSARQSHASSLNGGKPPHGAYSTSTNSTSPTPTQIVEANGWIIGANGQVALIATAPSVTPYSPGLTPAECGAGKSSPGH